MQRVGSRILLAAALLAPLTVPSSRLAAAPRAAAAPQVSAVDEVALKQKLAALKGKVVVLNMWATWCGPCVSEFPDLVKLDQLYRKRGVTVIALSVDDPPTARQAVSQFAARQRATFPIYTLKPTADTGTIVRVFDRNWTGAIPMTYVFDRSGRLQTRFTGARSLEGFEMAVKPLLTKAPAKQARR
jgi:thiol-disulfide isomerase/thioredoxin